MDIVVHQDNLQRALGLLERITAKNAALPILNNILLKTEGGRLKLAATNLEVGITATIGAKVQKEGQIAVPGRIMADLARAARADTVALSVDQNVLSVSSGSYRTSVLCFDASEYPIIPRIEKGVAITVGATEFASLLASVADSIASSDARPELSGALVRFKSDGVTAAATDSFRLVERTLPLTDAPDAVIIVPRATVFELIRTLTGAAGDVTVHLSDNQASFVHGEFEVVSRLIDGKYPDYRKVVPERFLSKALVRKDELIDAIKVAALFASSISDVKLECADGELRISAKNASKGEGQATAKANLKGEAFDIALNYHYLLDGLKVMPTDTVVLEFTGKGSPFVLRPSDSNTGFVYLVMPLRG